MKLLSSDYLKGKRVFVFLGIAGSGKTEIALNFALFLKRESELQVHFFDMDQTKALFRARDAALRLENAGISFHGNFDLSIEDVAAIAPGVKAALNEKNSIIVMDVGGNEQGARVIGQFFEELNRNDCMILLPVNPFRPWMETKDSLADSIAKIKKASRIESCSIVSNPNLCGETSADTIIEGNNAVKQMISREHKIIFVCALEQLCPKLEGKIKEAVLPLNIQITYPWMDSEDQ